MQYYQTFCWIPAAQAKSISNDQRGWHRRSNNSRKNASSLNIYTKILQATTSLPYPQENWKWGGLKRIPSFKESVFQLQSKATRQVASQKNARVNLRRKCRALDKIASTAAENLMCTSITHIAFWRNPTYKLHIFTGIHSHILTSTECLVDSGARHNLNNAYIVYKKWTSFVKYTSLLRLQTAVEKPTQLHETILLQPRLDDLITQVWLGIVYNIAFNFILGTSFIDRLMCAIFPGKQRVVPWHLQPLPMVFPSYKWNTRTSALLIAHSPPRLVHTATAYPIRLV